MLPLTRAKDHGRAEALFLALAASHEAARAASPCPLNHFTETHDHAHSHKEAGPRREGS